MAGPGGGWDDQNPFAELDQAVRGEQLVNETIQNYVDRILGYTQGQEPLKVQAATASALVRLVKGVSPAKLRKRSAPEQWSVAEILAHLADSEIVCGWRLRAILGAPGNPIEAYDQNAWAAAGHYASRDPRQSIAQFREMRNANLLLLNSLTPEQWSLYGLHAERGKESVERIVNLMAGHDLNHLQQIKRLLAPPKRKPAKSQAGAER
jgi:hypothetical protein